MSKLYNTYTLLKKQDSETIYLFKSGIFYIVIDNDAQILSKYFHFKLSNLTDNVVKCGFPCTSFEKYSKLFKAIQLKVKIVSQENSNDYNNYSYNQSKPITELLDEIISVNVDNLSISEAYKWIENIKSKANKIRN